MSVENIPISQLTEATEVLDSDFLAIDNGTTTKKITVENFNATGTASAQAAAAAAAQSASDASDSATAAQGYKNTVESALNDASTIVSNAQSYANSAESSKNDASGYASAASTSASQAATSANQAASYATGVQAYATEAKSWAQGGTGTRVDEETTNCEYYANAAHTSETNAASSESNAASSESNAATSESNASASASSANTNALKAEGYAVGTQNGTPAASGDSYYQDNAKYYKEQAASSETNAASSEYNAGLSESAAAASATAAGESEEDSEAWAWGKVDGVDVPATHPAYHNNAKYWADVAAGGVSGVSSFNGRSGNVVPASGDYAANIIEYDNDDSGLTADTVQEAIDEVQGEISSLATVATTGDYSDLSNTPNLATVATSGSYSDLSNTPNLATVATSGSYNDLSNKPTLGTAAAKDSTNAVTQSSTDLIESGAVYTGLAGKEDAAKVLTAQTLSVGATTLTFTDSSIGNNSRIRVISNPFTTGLLNAVQSGTSVTLTFEAQESALSVTLEVRN